MFKNFLGNIWSEAYLKNDRNILSFLEVNPNAVVLDIGCGDGQKTVKFREKIKSRKIFGADGVHERLKAAKKRGINTIFLNLEEKWPFKSNTFDVVVSNQVIEHVANTDLFIEEVYRILRPGGYCVISTENLSSWHNIFALILGFQDFSHHPIKKLHVSNPFSLHYGEKTVTWSKKDNSGVDDTAFPHLKIFTYLSLIRIFNAYNLKIEGGKGSGYYPLFGFLSQAASTLDLIHSHFITIKARKN